MDRKKLLEKLENVGKALATNDLIPVMKCFLFDGERLIANNDSLAITTPCKTDEAFALDGKVLVGLLSAAKGDEVTFKIEGYEVLIKSGRSRYKMEFRAADEFIFKDPEVEEWDVNVWNKKLEVCLLEPGLLTSAKDTTQPAFMGILVNGNLYSSDGDAITRYSQALKPDNQLQPYMIPNEFCHAVLKMSEDKKTLINLAPGWATAEIGEYIVWGRLIDPPTVNFEETIEKTIGTKEALLPWVKIPEGLNATLTAARVIADPEGKPTNLTVDKGKLHLLTTTSSYEVEDDLELDEHPKITARVSAELMQRSIAMTSEMAILKNCCCFKRDNLFVLLSNYS